MYFAVSRRNTLYYDRTSLNYLNRAKEKLMDSWYLYRDSKGATSECNAEAIQQAQTC
jgi:hypothetical protein